MNVKTLIKDLAYIYCSQETKLQSILLIKQKNSGNCTNCYLRILPCVDFGNLIPICYVNGIKEFIFKRIKRVLVLNEL